MMIPGRQKIHIGKTSRRDLQVFAGDFAVTSSEKVGASAPTNQDWANAGFSR
jgi:hypothetical protein